MLVYSVRYIILCIIHACYVFHYSSYVAIVVQGVCDLGVSLFSSVTLFCYESKMELL